MLVLSRDKLESVVICDGKWREITRVVVVRSLCKVRLGFESSGNILYLRAELYDTPEFRAKHGLPPVAANQ